MAIVITSRSFLHSSIREDSDGYDTRPWPASFGSAVCTEGMRMRLAAALFFPWVLFFPSRTAACERRVSEWHCASGTGGSFGFGFLWSQVCLNIYSSMSASGRRWAGVHRPKVHLPLRVSSTLVPFWQPLEIAVPRIVRTRNGGSGFCGPDRIYRSLPFPTRPAGARYPCNYVQGK